MKKMKSVWAILVACCLVGFIFGVQTAYTDEAAFRPSDLNLNLGGQKYGTSAHTE